MVRQIDWEERCWQLTHDVAVRLALEAKDTATDPPTLAGEAVNVAVWTCSVYRQVTAQAPKTANQKTGDGL